MKAKINRDEKNKKIESEKKLVKFLADSSAVHFHFNNFIDHFYWAFRESKGITLNAYPEVEFSGFDKFSDPQQGKENKAGHCNSEFSYYEENKMITKVKLQIWLNHWFLLDKLGMDKLIKNEPKPGATHYSIDVSFNSLIETIAHELAHAYQTTVNNFPLFGQMRSQCESTGEGKRKWIVDEKGNKIHKLIEPEHPQLVIEHTQLTSEILQMITSSPEYQKLKKWWTTKHSPLRPDTPSSNNKCENCNRNSLTALCKKCLEERRLEQIFYTIGESKNLTDLENNYQLAQKESFYQKKGKKREIDNLYLNTKNYLIEVQKKNDEWKKNIGLALMAIGAISIIALIINFWSGNKRKRRKY